jgi:hypothetical protein
MLWFNQIIYCYISVYTATLYREIVTLCHIISFCYIDYMFRTGNAHLQVLHLPIRLLHLCQLQNIHLCNYYGIKTSLTLLFHKLQSSDLVRIS